jgi:elongation factor Ts
MTDIEKVKHIRDITLSPMNKISEALLKATGNVSDAIAILINAKQADVTDMANRKADNCIVYSYVHNNKIGAMLKLASQTDFVAKNELFIQLAKDLCMHIVSNPIIAEYVSYDDVPYTVTETWNNIFREEAKLDKKPVHIINKIVQGKMTKKMEELCLLEQKFIKNDKITIRELINQVSSTVGEKIEIKKYIRLSA